MKKGISQIVSSVLLMAIAVSIAGVYSEWAPEFSEETSQKIADQTNNQLKCNNADFRVSEVKYDITGQQLTFEISNTGTINFNNDITVSSINSSNIVSQKTIESLEVDENRLIELNSDKITQIMVVTSRECPELRQINEDIDVTK